jgi:hypothetical protein
MWRAASARGLTSPDRPAGARPAQCQLDDTAHMALLRDRATGSALDERPDHVLVSSPAGAGVMTWTGRRFDRQLAGEQTPQVTFPDADDDETGNASGAALFTRRGDVLRITVTNSVAHHRQVAVREIPQPALPVPEDAAHDSGRDRGERPGVEVYHVDVTAASLWGRLDVQCVVPLPDEPAVPADHSAAEGAAEMHAAACQVAG